MLAAALSGRSSVGDTRTTHENLATGRTLMNDWQLTDSLTEHVRNVSGAERLIEKKGDLGVIDASKKFVLLANNSPKHFLLVSHIDFGDVVGQGVKNAQQLRSQLPAATAERIARPTHSGLFERFSFAIYPLFAPLNESRILGRLQNLMVFPKVLTWHRSVVSETKKAFDDRLRDQTLERLEKLAECFQAHATIQQKTKRALTKLATSDHATLYRTAAHNDLWRGNVLRAGRDVRIIDWGGLNMESNPFYDLARLLPSFRTTGTRAKRVLHDYCQMLNCEYKDVMLYFYIAMADQLHSLDNFPMNRFREMVVNSDDILERYLK